MKIERFRNIFDFFGSNGVNPIVKKLIIRTNFIGVDRFLKQLTKVREDIPIVFPFDFFFIHIVHSAYLPLSYAIPLIIRVAQDSNSIAVQVSNFEVTFSRINHASDSILNDNKMIVKEKNIRLIHLFYVLGEPLSLLIENLNIRSDGRLC